MAFTTFHEDGTTPGKNWVFVFGSNLAGIHGAGAAKVAKEKYGAEPGIGIGLTGMSYAIPTKDRDIKTLPLFVIEKNIRDFVKYTRNNSDIMKFFVTAVGCGLAGFKDHQIAPLFRGARKCSFPSQWRQYLE